MNLKDILSQINQQIAEMNFGEQPTELYAPIRYLMDLGGKRMRPLLTVLGYQLFADDISKVIRPAIGIEVFHNFTLMHDYIMDKAPLRRGEATVHEKWNENIAILSGDVMLVKAYELLMDVEDQYLRKVLQKFNQCAAEVCEGQQWDMNFEQISQVTENQYLEMIRLKTAVLLGFALELGGILAGANEKNTQLLRKFGENMGIGFQLKDDLLDVYAESDKFGKQVGGDIIANKKTFLLIEALTKAEGNIKKELDYWLGLKEFDKSEKVKAVTEIYNQLHIKELTQAKIDEYFKLGFEQLEKLDAQENRKQFLKGFVEEILNREK